MLALLNPESLLTSGGIFLLAAIVFAESGLLVGFFLPGDSLLFVAGFLASPAGQDAIGKHVLPNIVVVMAVAGAMAVVGDQVGYLIGKKLGPAVFARPKSRLFDPAHVVRAQEFFAKYGTRTIIIARFVPVVRTFVPVVAGVGEMEYKTFTRFNIVGGLAWGSGIPLLGFFLGKIDAVKNNIEIAILAIVLVSLLPVIFEFIKHRRSAAH
jgi:membrane-associated protein